MSGARGSAQRARLAHVLFVSAFVIATCGLVYELVAGALASYLLGDSVTQFSLVIGTYLSAMGVGSYLSRFLDRSLVARFVEIEVAVALIGGFEGPMLYAAFAYTDLFRAALFGLVAITGILVGLELPLLIRILEQRFSLKELVARVLFLDYIGALAASLAFPLLVLPRLGILRTSLVFGLLNALVAFVATLVMEAPRPVRLRLQVLSLGAVAALVAGLLGASQTQTVISSALYADEVVFRSRSPYQQVVVTKGGKDVRLFINGALQFSTMDEYRYHEALVHPALVSTEAPRRVLVLGGGDGMAVREVLRHDSVVEVVLVDLDPMITDLFSARDELGTLNDQALTDTRVTVVNADAFTWLEDYAGPDFDAAIIDFPDPNNYGLGKLYTDYFYRHVAGVLTPEGTVGVQATSPLFSPDAFWCIIATMEHAGLTVRPYHAYIPSFGEWGYVLATPGAHPPTPGPLPDDLRFLDDDTLATLFHFPRDMTRPDPPVNRLDNQILVRLYEQDWREMRAWGH